jgi:hypothetical protein
MLKYIFFFLTLFWFTTSRSQDLKQGLIVAHYDNKGRTELKQKIYDYHFVNGNYIGREELITVSGLRDGKDFIRLDLGKNTIYKDRYLITSIGNIIDLKERKVLFEGKGKLLKCLNDSAIFYTNDISRGKFYSVYDFKNKKYAEVRDLSFKAIAGRDVEFDKSNTPYKLYLYPDNAAKVLLLADAGYGQIPAESGVGPDPVLWWLDNDNFVYAHFNMANTQIVFNKVNVESLKSTLVGKIEIQPESSPAVLEMSDEKKAAMILGSSRICIDTEKNVVKTDDFSETENGFCYERIKNKDGYRVRLKEKEIGSFYFQPTNFRSSKNAIALVKELVIDTEAFHEGIVVWHEKNQTWKPIDCEEVISLAGWINE